MASMFAATLWMLSRWWRSVESTIHDAKVAAEKASKAAEKAQDAVRTVSMSFSKSVLTVTQGQGDLSTSVGVHLAKMNELFAKAIELTSQTVSATQQTSKDLSVFKEQTTSNGIRIATGGKKLAQRLIQVESEVKEIAKEVFRVQNKVDKKKGDS